MWKKEVKKIQQKTKKATIKNAFTYEKIETKINTM